MLQADLSRQEQEMRDSRIELRIARRESKTALDKLVKLEESVKLPDSSQIKVPINVIKAIFCPSLVGYFYVTLYRIM